MKLPKMNVPKGALLSQALYGRVKVLSNFFGLIWSSSCDCFITVSFFVFRCLTVPFSVRQFDI